MPRLSAPFQARLALLTAVSLAGIIAIVPRRTSAQNPDSVSVALRARDIVVSRKTSTAFWTAVRASPGRKLHGLVWMPRHPTPLERDAFRAIGITILSPLRGKTYWALVAASSDTARAPIRPLLFAQMEARDRVDPDIWNATLTKYESRPVGGRILNYVLNTDSTLNVGVLFHNGTSRVDAERILRTHARRIARLSDLGWKVIASHSEVRQLAESDAIQWIGSPLPPVSPDNDQTRQTINANAVQNFNTTAGIVQGLGGKGVTIGVFDTGIDETHDDFGPRVIHNDHGKDWHATHVAGVIAGDGRLSVGSDSWLRANNGTPFQWRGIAPESELIDANAQNAFNAAIMSGYIQASGMDISNHAYSYSNDGEYNALGDGFHDQLIRGDATNDGSPIAARAHVYSTGNRGDIPRLGGEQVGYFSLSKQSKNGIMVGGYDPQANRIDPTSSLGPAHDGRIKPDVVAPGSKVRSTGYCAINNDPQAQCVNPPSGATLRSDFYHLATGSSDAAAAVTGMLALVLQQFQITYSSVNPNWALWPSTLRALTIQTAHDISGPVWYPNADGPVQAFPGPDFTTGYGMVDAKAAVDLVAGGRFAQDFITSTCNTRSWWMRSDGVSELRVTLAWDDLPATSLVPYTDPKLENDLDLELIDPSSSTVSYPWLLDQRVVDPSGNPISDAAQVCDTDVTVQRNVMPTPTPNNVGLNHPNNVNDPIAAGALQAAVKGKDHLNNAEQVVVAAPAAGWWQIRIVGFKVTQGPQRFSLAASGKPWLYLPVAFPTRFCWLSLKCAPMFDRRVCDKAPKICSSPPFAATPGQIDVSFRNPEEAVFIPLDRLCLFLVECPVCAIEARCRELDVSFVQMPVPLTLEVYEATGRRIFSDASNRTTKRVRVQIRPERSYVLAVKANAKAKLNTKYELRVEAARQQADSSKTPLTTR